MTFSSGERPRALWALLFKVMLVVHCQSLSKRTKLEDESGRELPAITVFSRLIEALKRHLYDQIEKREQNLNVMEDIKWVLAVPAVWGDGAYEFMREAAIDVNFVLIRIFQFIIEQKST